MEITWDQLTYEYKNFMPFPKIPSGLAKNPLSLLKFFYYSLIYFSSCRNAHETFFVFTKMQKAYETMLRQIYFCLAFSTCHHYIYVFTTAWFSPKVANYVNYFRNKRGLLKIKKDKSSYFLCLSNNLIFTYVDKYPSSISKFIRIKFGAKGGRRILNGHRI